MASIKFRKIVPFRSEVRPPQTGFVCEASQTNLFFRLRGGNLADEVHLFHVVCWVRLRGPIVGGFYSEVADGVGRRDACPELALRQTWCSPAGHLHG